MCGAKSVHPKTILSGSSVPIHSVISLSTLIIHHLPQEATRASPRVNLQMKSTLFRWNHFFFLFSVILFPVTGEWTFCNQLLRGQREFDCWQSSDCCSHPLRRGVWVQSSAYNYIPIDIFLNSLGTDTYIVLVTNLFCTIGSTVSIMSVIHC